MDYNYSNRFEKFFRQTIQIFRDKTIFFVPATLSSNQNGVNLQTACWQNHDEKKDDVLEAFTLYYSILKQRPQTENGKAVNMSQFILENVDNVTAGEKKMEARKNYVWFRIDNGTLTSNLSVTGHTMSDDYARSVERIYEDKWESAKSECENAKWDKCKLINKNSKDDWDFNEHLVGNAYSDSLDGVDDQTFLLTNLMAFCEKSGLKYVYYVITMLQDEQPDNYIKSVNSSGVMVVCSDKELNDEYELPALCAITDGAIAYSAYEDIRDFNSSYREVSERAAQAAIMSRNMSHNLGSHVLAYLKQDIDTAGEIYAEELDGKGRLHRFLDGLGCFVPYLQERQDFIASAAAGIVPYFSNVNFKEFVYDELEPGGASGSSPDNILLGNLARSEGLGRPVSISADAETMTEPLGDIVLRFRTFNGTTFESSASPAFGNIVASMPGGVAGRQAVFSILENVIRNAAKHGNWRTRQHLELTLDIYVKESQPKYDDNVLSLGKILNDLYVRASDGNDLYFVVLTDNLQCSDDSLKKLRNALCDSLVDDDGRMKEENKGIKEMRISASWLRAMNNDYASDAEAVMYEDMNDGERQACLAGREQGKSRAPILYVRTEGGHLQYIFCLMRPKKVAVVSRRFDDRQMYDRDKFASFAWSLFTPEEYMETRNKSYEFILVDGVSDKEYEDIRIVSSSRLCKLSDVCPRIGFDTPEAFYNAISVDGEFNENGADEVLAGLYKILCGAEDTGTPVISVFDESAWALNNGGSTDENITKGLAVISRIGDNVLPYVYRSHYEAEENFRFVIEHMGDNGIYGGNLFIEGISAGNSTSRLVRNETIDDVWCYKHLHAMKQKIAVFDERLFFKVFGIGESEINNRTLSSIKDDYVRYIQEHGTELDIESEKEMNDLCRELRENKTLNELNEYMTELLKIYEIDAAPVVKTPELALPATSYTGTAYAQKGVSVFTLIQNSSDRSSFSLCGLRWENEDVRSTLDRDGGKLNSRCEVIATMAWDKDNPDDPLRIEQVGNTPITVYRNAFDKISVHQGLLDKMYTGFGIEKDDRKSKEQVTRKLYDWLHRTEEAKETAKSPFRYESGDGVGHWYLPGMSIHSGRSKPNSYDMPQHLPFVQYASLEHAVLDCKYSLVELLDAARYE